jgi:hypothetical protein
MNNYALQVLQNRLHEVNYYIRVMKNINPDEYKHMPDYHNLRKKRMHLQRVIAIIKVMDLNAV